MSAVLARSTFQDGTLAGYLFWCPGCHAVHPINVANPAYDARIRRNVWAFDGNEARPTFTPSLLVYGDADLKTKPVPHEETCGANGAGATPGCLRELGHGGPCRATEAPARPRCHSFIRAGRIEFCGDSGHSLAGKTVDLPPWRGWDNDEEPRP